MLEIHEYLGDGYKPLVDYDAWRVAILRYMDAFQPDRITVMERHNDTDEVFVLLSGQCILITGGDNSQINEIRFQQMKTGVIYNVKRSTWHTNLLSRDASVLIVENLNTGESNSEFYPLAKEHRQLIVERALAEKFE